VVDGAHSGPNRGLDARGTVGVGGHRATPAVRFGDRGPNLFVRVRLLLGRDSLRQHRPRNQDLDVVGAVLEVRVSGLGDLVGSVGKVLDRGTCTNRENWRASPAPPVGET
jgi:hypothetical protein